MYKEVVIIRYHYRYRYQLFLHSTWVKILQFYVLYFAVFILDTIIHNIYPDKLQVLRSKQRKTSKSHVLRSDIQSTIRSIFYLQSVFYKVNFTINKWVGSFNIINLPIPKLLIAGMKIMTLIIMTACLFIFQRNFNTFEIPYLTQCKYKEWRRDFQHWGM